MGQVIDSRKVLELPLIAGNVTVMANLSPGVLFQPTFPKDVRPFDTGSGSAIAGDGTRIGAAQFQVDGAMNNANSGFAYSPPPEWWRRSKSDGLFRCEFGFLTGVTVNMSLKSGTNQSARPDLLLQPESGGGSNAVFPESGWHTETDVQSASLGRKYQRPGLPAEAL